MKKINKVLSILAIGTIALGVASCGNTIPNDSKTQTPSASVESKEKYVTFMVKDDNGDWKQLSNPALITDGKVTLPTAPAKEYYTFRGWFIDENYVTELRNENLNSNVTAYAYYVADEVNIVINGESQGTRDLKDVIDGTYNPGEGLTFDGWYTNAECSVKYEAGDPAKTLYAQSVAKIVFNNGYEDVYVTSVKPNTVYGNPSTTYVLDDNNQATEDTVETKNIVKSYMSSEDIYYVDEDGNEIDFSKAITKNTTIKVLWKSPFLGYKKSPNSDDLYCSGSNYGDSSYYASDKNKATVDAVPVISIPSKITVTDEDGNKKTYNVVAACLREGNTFNSTNLKKMIVNEGIGYIRGFSSTNGASSIEKIELPSTLKIIQDCFNNINGLTSDTVTIPNGVKGIYDSFWNKCSGDYNGTIFNSGSEYDFDIEIPDSVESLSIIPLNFKFSANSSFVKENDMIYQNLSTGKNLVAYRTINNGTVTVPEGFTSIQVGAFVDMNDLKVLNLPSTFNQINYNLNLSDYKYCYVWDQSDYSNNECYLYAPDLSENDFAYNGRLIVNTLTNLDYVVVNNTVLDTEVLKAFGGNVTGWATMTGSYTYGNDVMFNNVKIVYVAENLSPIVKVTLKIGFTNQSFEVSITRTSNEPITMNQILTAIDEKYSKGYLSMYTSDHLTVNNISQFGNDYDLSSLITTNKYLDIEIDLQNYPGVTYEANGNEITVTGFDKNSAYDLGGNSYGVIIPDEIDGKKVTKIAENAFKDNGIIKAVKLGKNIKEIGVSAFEGCTALSNIIFNDASLEVIGSCAFKDTIVTNLSFKTASLRSVGTSAFAIETLTSFTPVKGEENRSETTVKAGEFYFGKELINDDNTGLSNNQYVSLLQLNTTTKRDGKTVYNARMFAYATAIGEVILGKTTDNYYLTLELMEGSVYGMTTSTYISFISIDKIHTKAFKNCQIAKSIRYKKYSSVGMNITASVSTISDLVSALPNVFEENWFEGYNETIAAYKIGSLN